MITDTLPKNNEELALWVLEHSEGLGKFTVSQFCVEVEMMRYFHDNYASAGAFSKMDINVRAQVRKWIAQWADSYPDDVTHDSADQGLYSEKLIYLHDIPVCYIGAFKNEEWTQKLHHTNKRVINND